MPFIDLDLSKRLERAEGNACMQFAEARRRIYPESGAEWMECAGAYVVFDGIESPVTQTFGLGLFESLAVEALDEIERFFRIRGAPVMHEVSPFAGVPVYDLLCSRCYRPREISNVLYRLIDDEPGAIPPHISVRVVGSEDAELWARTNARGWASERPDFEAFLLQMGAIICARKGSPSFLAAIDGQAAAAGSLAIHEGVALFAGAATVPEMRRRGLQTALLRARLAYAREHACDLAMMVAEPGSESQRNAERGGFRVAYTRIKWRLQS
ncbi:MAG TPA: GNAT family N-acetyltransferase [Candidatus Aquilonibacter sp.]|nr:GNAT family N-acetyltransferase [Candidatus Aquilonibacter sp.]